MPTSVENVVSPVMACRTDTVESDCQSTGSEYGRRDFTAVQGSFLTNARRLPKELPAKLAEFRHDIHQPKLENER